LKQVQDDVIVSDERQTKMMNENRLSDDNFLTNIRMEVLIQSITRRSCSPLPLWRGVDSNEQCVPIEHLAK
ncbi:MAG: hypothetical protein UHS32_08305, partial [Bacteroidaceae bacterium]|nr:hypothetical protein [Bacteroidaceae bacterium]